MKRFAAFILAAGMLLCLGCADGNVISCPAGDGSARGNAAPTQLNRVEKVKVLSFEKWSAQREAMGVDESTYGAMAAFAAKSAGKVLNGTDKNANYSPFSLYYALAMAAQGANGKTAEEMLNLLGMSDAKTLAEQCGNMYRMIASRERDGTAELMLADSLWLSDNYDGAKVNYNQDFLNTCAEQFYAEVFGADFTGQKTADAMTKWIKEKTNGTLAPEMELDPETMLSIINTLYLKDEWTDRFDKNSTADGTFTKANGEKVTCSFMNAIKNQGFMRGENYTASMVSMKNFGSMWFILPDEGVSTDDILSSPETLEEILAGETNGYGMVTFSIPKFEFTSKFNLMEALKSLGMEKAFDSDADFSGISDRAAFISAVKQETYIAIDEVGVEASAFTQIDYCGAGMPQDNAELILDRPFIYIIKGSAPLFMGVINDPSAN